jgi:hypothetical protein
MRRTALLAGLLAFAVALLPLGAGKAHAGADMHVVSSGARVDFPAGVTFSLEATSDAGISDVALLVSTPGQRYGAYTRNVRPDFTPGNRVTASWTWKRYGSILPPGAGIVYHWRLTGADGAVTETPDATIRVDDTRFQWQEVSAPNVTLRWHQGDESFGRDLLNAAASAISELGGAQGVDLQRPVVIYVYANQGELFSALPGTPAWIGGISIGEWDTVLVPVAPNGDTEGRRALVHELTHELIYQITFSPGLGSQVPAWLNEGLAVVSEGDTTAVARRALQQATLSDRVPTLRTLGPGFSNMSDADAQVAYAAAESVVRYLLDTYGPDQMRALLKQFGQGLTADNALRRVYGKGQDEIEDGWRMSLGLRPRDRSGGEPAPAAAATPADGTNTTLIVGVAAALAGTLLFAGGGATFLVLRRSRR